MLRWTVALAVFCTALGCSNLTLEPPGGVIHARFDPDAKVIPMPTDVLRDGEAGRLDLPLDDEELTPAEREFYTFLNTMDGWSTTTPATVEFTAPIARATVDEDTVQVWQWRETPRRVEGVRVALDDTETTLTIDPPREGWRRGGRYFVVVRGGAAGVEGKQGERVECDAAFYFLRLTESLDTPQHERAFPGDTRAERVDNATQLEDIRAELSPYFDFFAARGMPRDEVAALWSFTVTTRTELAMDKTSQRMPLPIDLLIDPDTRRVELPVAEWDSDVEANAKVLLAEYDGFGTSQNTMFGFTGPIDVATITEDTVQLYEVSGQPRLVPSELQVLDDLTHVIVRPKDGPLAERTRYAIIVRQGVRDAEGNAIALMPVGHFLQARSPLYRDGESQVGVIDAADARKVDLVRRDVGAVLGDLGATDVLAAWTFTTMSIKAPLVDLMNQPALLDVSVDPTDVTHMTPGEAVVDFALGITGLFNLGDVYNGYIESPIFLDPETRAFRTDGGHAVEKIGFTLAVPRNIDPGKPLPMVIFGHGVMSERRFVLAVADALAARGYASIAIDLPYHGHRTYCWSEGPLTAPNPQTGELTGLDPCKDGFTCREDGKCVDPAGKPGGLRKWPIIGMYQASGAAFIEIERIANTRDHFRQSLIDLSALSRSLRKGDWRSVIGAPLRTDKLYYAGMSLGGIIGATFVALSPEIERAVLNVPGADTVDLFDESPFFGGQVAAFFKRQNVDRASYDGYRFMNVARWFMDSADPQMFATELGEHDAMIQMATLDFIIPNTYTKKLEALSGLPRRDYIGEHAFVVVPIEPAYLRGTLDMARFISGDLIP